MLRPDACSMQPAMPDFAVLTSADMAVQVGYDKAAAIAKKAFETGKTVRQIAMEEKVLSEDKLRKLLDARGMTEPGL